MVYRCDTCRLVSSVRYSNCPGCGYGLEADQRSLEELTKLNYRQAGKKRPVAEQPPTQIPAPSPGYNEPNRVVIDDNDYLSKLRSSFRTTPCTPEPQRTAPVVTPQDPQPQRTAPVVTPQDPQPQPAPTTFFDLTPPEVEPIPEPDPIPPVGDHFYVEPERRTVTGSRRRPGGFARFWRGFWNFIFLVPWRAVFILLTVIAIIVIGVVIWNMRHQIVSAILTFLIELIPIGLLIGGIVYLIRRIFR